MADLGDLLPDAATVKGDHAALRADRPHDRRVGDERMARAASVDGAVRHALAEEIGGVESAAEIARRRRPATH